ncbi:MAG: response regulator transcription factor [Clostridiales bacterium]|nr:response regulator transcription factor [Clostridiales bacterium]
MPLSVVVILENPDAVCLAGPNRLAPACEIVGVARNLRAARDLLTACRPDIVLMDLLPPAQDAFALLVRMRAAWPDARVILCSRRTSLDVTRQAIRLGVADMLQTPVPAAALREALARAAREARLARDRAEALLDERRRARLLTLLTNDERGGRATGAVLQAGADAFLADESAAVSERGTATPPRETTASRPTGETGVGPESETPQGGAASGDDDLPLDAYCVLVAQPREATADPAAVMARTAAALRRTGIPSLSATLYDAVVLVLTQEPADGNWQAAAAAAADVVAEAAGVPVRIGIGRPAHTRGMLRAAYQQARSALWDITLRGEACSRGFYQGVTRQGGGRLTEVHRELEALIEKAELTDRSADEAAEIIGVLSGRQYSHLRAIVSLYAMALCRRFACPADGQVGSAMHEAWFVGNGEEVRACLRRICAALRACREAREGELSPVCRSALWYVRLHAVEGPALCDVAGLLHVSPKYLSALIRRETGVTFHEHVRDARMERARALLTDPCVSVAEVARAAGYANYITFFNVFKRVEQMTPTEYRRREGRFAALPENAG